MRFLRFELRNYAGIMNGMGIETLTIDFSKSKNIITLICGKNGVGKSTLLKAMNPLPDTTDCYLEGAPAHKAMIISDKESIYEIMIVSDINSNLVRQTNKAYVKKNGIELNPTGNIGSYKDIIFNEFDLDANYITLARLSNEDRGLAMKTPSERKKFIASILSTIEVYNSINKALVKRVNVFKSYINNLDSKIKNIGDPIQLQMVVEETDMRYKRLQMERDNLTGQLGEMNGFIKAADPDGSIQDQYQKIYDQIQIVNENIKSLTNTLNIANDIPMSDVENMISKNTEALNKINIELESTKIKYETIITNKSELYHKLEVDKQKLDNQKSGFEFENLEETVYSYRNQVKQLENKFASAQIPYETISRDEFTTLLDILENIRENINGIYFHYDKELVSSTIDIYNKGINVNKRIEELTLENNSLTEEIALHKADVVQYEKQLESSKNLTLRPKSCKIDSCPFVKEMIDTDKNKDKIMESINSLGKLINSKESKKVKNTKDMEKYDLSKEIYNQLRNIFNIITANKKIISKFKLISFFLNEKEMLDRIDRSDIFIEIDELFKYVDIFNEAESLKNIKVQLVDLEANYKVALAKQETIKLIEDDISNTQEKLRKAEEDDKEYRNKIVLLEESVKYNENILQYEKELLSNIVSKKELKDQYAKIKQDISKIKEYVDNINIINSRLQAIAVELPSIEKERDDLNFALTNLKQYQSELEQYQTKYNYTNTLKKYSSPTTGIQTLYMDMYMGKTLKMANDLLSMMFDGEYSLLPYIVNEQEFRIPFIGNGLPVDDISSGSTSQLCIIGTIMNLVLLYQASTHYNIVSLDEVDGGLDNHNRYNFIPTLYKLIEILDINQLIMISHNIESDLSNVDVIKLKGYEDDSIDYKTANIIFDYNNI